MNKIWEFLCLRKEFYLFTILIIGIFYLVLYLYGAFIDAIIYATILCVTFLLIYMGFDFYHFYQKSLRLEQILEREYIEFNDLPISSSLIEDHYQELLIKIEELHQALKAKSENEYLETIDYFTLWVHQIKIPISALRLLIQSQQMSAHDLLVQVLKIEQYVEMALHYMKMNHMSSDLCICRYELSDILNEVIQKQAVFFIQKKIGLNMSDISLQILTDEKWISFVIEQILSNALKYTKEGCITIDVKDEILYIKDTGIGIKQSDLPRVFEKGFTGYNGRIDKKANGIGLYLCKTIIDNLGYQIDIQSELGKGTVVSINFHVDELHVE